MEANFILLSTKKGYTFFFLLIEENKVSRESLWENVACKKLPAACCTSCTGQLAKKDVNKETTEDTNNRSR
jgi:hypothetical protein